MVPSELINIRLIAFQSTSPANRSPLCIQVYSCRLADMLICLHSTGGVSLFYCAPVSASESPITKNDNQNDQLIPPVDLKYAQVCASKSLRRGRNFQVLAMTVDPTRELTVTIAASDGRLQVFYFLEQSRFTSCWFILRKYLILRLTN